MTDSAMAAILARTYFHTVTAFRPLAAGGEETVCEDAKCALSRSAHTSAPTPPEGAQVLPEALYRLSLFTRPELSFRLGDRVEVTDTRGRVYHGRTSDSFCYPSHCVTVVAVSEVGAPGETQQSGSAGERTSIEVSELSVAQEGPPTETSVSFSVGERRSSETSELSAAAESEGYGACSDGSEGYGDCEDDGQDSCETGEGSA